MKEMPRENFRWTSHTGGLTTVKPKDYDGHEGIEAATPYAAWKLLAGAGADLRPGDLLEVAAPDETAGALYITKYIGFEPAQWYVAELRTEALPATAEFVPVSAAAPSFDRQD